MKTLIKNARVVLPQEIVETSVLIERTRIADIDPADAHRGRMRSWTRLASICCRA